MSEQQSPAPQKTLEMMQLEARAEEIFGSLEAARIKELPVMFEREFVEFYLPMLMGDKDRTKDGIHLGVWVHKARSVYGEVRILGDQGQELFVVPPVYVGSDFDHQLKTRGDERSREMPSINVAMNYAERLGFRSKAEAEGFIFSILRNYRDPSINFTDMVNYLTRWHDIATRYHYKLDDVAFLKDIADIIRATGGIPVEMAVNHAAAGDDDFEDA